MIRVVPYSVSVALLAAALMTTTAHAQYALQNPTEVTVINATNVFATAMQMPQNEIPRNLLANASGIAILPGMLRGAFVFGVQHGNGVLLTRDANGAWQAPRMIQISGGSFGYQIGVQATDLVLVFRTPQSVQNLLRGTLKVGVDASAAAGPVGRQASAGTDLRMGAEILSYSRARGAFVGVSIDGSVISLDPAAEAIYYQPPGAFPASAMTLIQTINAYTAAQPVAVPMPGQPQFAPMPGQPPAPPVGTTGWMPVGQGNTEATRQQLDSASRQLAASLDPSWQQYLALPAEVYTPNTVPNPQSMQQALQRYEDAAKQPQYAALKDKPGFQQTVAGLRRMSEVSTASLPPSTLPPPPPGPR